jgi:hypothetical protein
MHPIKNIDFPQMALLHSLKHRQRSKQMGYGEHLFSNGLFFLVLRPAQTIPESLS